MDIDPDVGVADADIRPLVPFLAEPVGNGVLHAVCHELGVAEVVGEDDGIDEKRLLHVHIVFPVHLPHHLIHLIGIGGFELLDGFEHFHGRTKAEIRPVKHFLISCERHHAVADLNVVGPQFGHFLRQHFFQPLECLGYDFKVRHK